MTQKPAPRVTLGLPVFEGGHLIGAAIESILQQDYGDFELIISDNASSDQTQAVCESWAARDARIRYIRHETNRGAAWNHNFCIHEARGDYFKWCSDDDRLAPSFLGKCVAALDADLGATLAHALTVDVTPDGEVIRRRVEPIVATQAAPHDRFRSVIFELQGCMPVFGVVRIETLRNTAMLGPYTASDRVLLAELALRGRWTAVPEYLFFHGEHPRRSTYTYPDLRARVEWFDTAKAGQVAFPSWRLAYELFRAIGRTPLTVRERLLAGIVALHRAFGLRQELVQDAGAGARVIVSGATRRWRSGEAA